MGSTRRHYYCTLRFKVAFFIVDDAEEPPPLQKDIFWDSKEPVLEDFPPWSDIYMNNMYQADTDKAQEGLAEDKVCEFRTIQEMRDPM